jgi:integrase
VEIFGYIHFTPEEDIHILKLSDVTIKSAKPGDKPITLWDGHGLHLCITPAGGKLWRWKYRFEGKERLMSLGSYPELSLSVARKKHQELRTRLVADGVDPMAERQAEKARSENTFAVIARAWHEHWKQGRSPRHADCVLRRLASDILLRIGDRPITEIEAPELVNMARAISDRGVYDLAKRSLQVVGQVFRYAIAHGYTKRNPAAEIRPGDILPKTTTTNYARVDAKDLPDLLRAIEVYQGAQMTRLAMKLMALTFVRTSELIGARWTEFDLTAARWDIPAERMKMRTPHIVPLSRQAVQLLELLHTLSGSSEYLFPGDRKNATMSNNTILKALERMGYEGKMTGHGFRGVAATLLTENDYPSEHIELQLAHQKRDKVAAAYNHAKFLSQRTAMMQWWADHLDRLIESKVVQFPART